MRQIARTVIAKNVRKKQGGGIYMATTAGLLFLLGSVSASANTPMKLTDSELDGVSAGAISVRVRARANGRNSSASASLTSTSNSNGVFSLNVATGVGQAFTCCNGGTSVVEISSNGTGIYTGGGSITSNIRILNSGSYSVGYGIQISVSSD